MPLPANVTYLHVSVARDLEREARSDGVDVTERSRNGVFKMSSACRGDGHENDTRQRIIPAKPLLCRID